MSAQPVEREDPLDPQLILDQFLVDERVLLVAVQRGSGECPRPGWLAGWKQLRRVLRRWRVHADAIGGPGYQEALDAARGPVSGGMPLEDAVRLYRPVP